MFQQNEDTRTRLLDRVRTALIRLNEADTPDDATLAQLVPLFENAANIVQPSGRHAAGHFLSFLQKPKQGLATVATAPMDPRLPCNGDIHDNASQLNQASARPPADTMPVVSSSVRPRVAEALLDAGAGATSQLSLSEVPISDTQLATGCFQPLYGYIAKQANPAHTQKAPLGTAQNPIGGGTRSHPY